MQEFALTKLCKAKATGDEHCDRMTSLERIVAPPGHTQRSRLTQNLCHVHWGFTVPGSVFTPSPNVVKRSTSESLADRLSVKKRYKVNANGSVGRWWFVVRGDKIDIDALVEAWNRISFHTAWRLEDMFSYVDDDLSPISPGISTSAASVFDKGSSSTIISTIAAAVSDKVSSISGTVTLSDEAMTNSDLLCDGPSNGNNALSFYV